ncbi:hypothetical protein FDUTEX481_04074 [Tolypothrix sp. PCC 7601]|nr:hypothetical protein FDUTEX481_04074 [Tolypothrix sp. PCC 7601]
MGIGHWSIVNWDLSLSPDPPCSQSPVPNPQSPVPSPQSPLCQ